MMKMWRRPEGGMDGDVIPIALLPWWWWCSRAEEDVPEDEETMLEEADDGEDDGGGATRLPTVSYLDSIVTGISSIAGGLRD